MNRIIILILIILLTTTTNIVGQEQYAVIATNGLIIREQPSIKSKQIGKLLSGKIVTIIKKTDKSIQITDQNKIVQGNWYQIDSKSGITGYVFSKYLLQKKTKFTNYCDRDYGDCNDKISTEDYHLTIYNYQEDSHKIKNDKLVIYEAVFNETDDRLIQILPKKEVQSIAVYYTEIETLNAWGEDKTPKWKGHKPYIKLKNENENYFELPTIKYDKTREARIKKMKLKKAPNFEEVGEAWWVPRYMYKGIVAPYQIESILLKVVLTYKNKKTKTKYIEINLSYGC